MTRFERFLDDETGAITVDWVVLTAGIVALAIVVTPPIFSAAMNLTSYIGVTIGLYQPNLSSVN
jgi:Flp pilus assembly pilin Flp